MKLKGCRACKGDIGAGGYQSHIYKHKRDFCDIIGRWEGDAWRINWEDVVMYYNPKEADAKKCLNYEKLGMRTQKVLEEF